MMLTRREFVSLAAVSALCVAPGTARAGDGVTGNRLLFEGRTLTLNGRPLVLSPEDGEIRRQEADR